MRIAAVRTLFLTWLLAGLLACQTTEIRQSATNDGPQGVAPRSEGMSEQERYDYFVESYTERARAGDWEAAHLFARRATELSVASEYAWMNRTNYAHRLGDFADAALSLIHIAQRYPGELSELSSRYLNSLIGQIKAAEGLEKEYTALLQALFDANWSYGYAEPSHLWRELVLTHLEEGRVEAARHVAARVNHPLVVAGMLSDGRYDPVTQVAPGQFDVEELATQFADNLRLHYRKNPYSLELIVELTYALIIIQDYEEVISITDSVLVAMNSAGDGRPLYEDFQGYMNWVLNNRSMALEAIGAWQAAIEVSTLASMIRENGNPNVSQVINMANLLCSLGETEAALTTIERVGDLMSDYGAMQVKAVEFCIAVQNGAKEESSDALEYMRQHKRNALQTYIEALLVAGSLEEVADEIVHWIQDPETRISALLYMQDFAEPPVLTPYANMLNRGRQAVKEIPRVQEAINKYGRVQSYDIRTIGG